MDDDCSGMREFFVDEDSSDVDVVQACHRYRRHALVRPEDIVSHPVNGDALTGVQRCAWHSNANTLLGFFTLKLYYDFD